MIRFEPFILKAEASTCVSINSLISFKATIFGSSVIVKLICFGAKTMTQPNYTYLPVVAN